MQTISMEMHGAPALDDSMANKKPPQSYLNYE